MKMTWNSNLYWCPRMKEADSTLRRTGSTSLNDCTPPYFINKGEPLLTGNNHRALMGGSIVSAARWKYQVLIDGV